MNGTHDENENKKTSRQDAGQMAEDFKRSQAAMVPQADKLVSKQLRLRFALMHANALQAGHMVGKMTLEVQFDFTPGKKHVAVRSAVLPPPVVDMQSMNIDA